MLEKTDKRLEYIDACKAIGIIMVILGHTYYAPQVVYNLIYSFHMPLFFIIAGFVFNKEKNCQEGFLHFLRKKVKHLLIPYLLFAFVNLLIQILWKALYLNEVIGFSYIKDNLIGIFFCYSSMQYMPNCSPIWFLLCLFIANVIFFWLLKMRTAYVFIPAVACMSICYYLSTIPHDYTSYPWKFPVFLMAVFLMYTGYCLRLLVDRYFKSYKHLFIIGSCLLFVISIVIEITTGNSVGMNENQFGSILAFLFTSIPISFSLVVLCKSCTILSRWSKLLWLGKNTIYVIGFNYLCRDIATEVYYLIPYLRNYQISFISLFIITFIICLVCLWICSLIQGKFNSIKRTV